jgi:hypothetical protein
MNSNKFLPAWIAGSAVLFLFGYLIYGMLLTDFMKTHSGTASNVMKDSKEFMIWLIAVANLVYGFLMTYIFGRAGVSSAGSGFALGATMGLFTSLSTDLINYATSNLNTGSSIAADVAAFTILTGLAGVVIGLIKGSGKKATA